MHDRKEEGFDSNLFPSSKIVYKTIVDSGYFNNFNELNYRVRGITKKEDYQEEIKDLTETEKASTLKLFDHILEEIKLKEIKGIQFAKFTHKLEGNMPHTHQNIIMLPEYMYNYISTNSTQNSFNKHGGTIIHELCHVLQRYYSKQFDDLYSRWNFRRYDISKLDGEIISRIRVNPDGLDNNWIWRYEYNFLLLAMYRNNAKFLNDVSYNYFVIDNDKIVKSGDILNEKRFNRFFRIDNNIYHPNEISAEYFSMYFMGKHIDGEGYKIFKNWIKRIQMT